MIERLVNEIRDTSFRLAVFGAGYVGLPTAALFADAGFHVVALDIMPEIVETVNKGFSFISEPGLDELVSHNVKAGRLRATMDSEGVLNQTDAIIISVQTPIDRNEKPNLSFLIEALKDVGKNLKAGMLVIISSTIPPGTMLRKVKPELESLSGLNADIEFFLAYVPERIAPGKALREFVESPRLIGGIGPNSTIMAAQLFKTVCKRVVETDAATAEVAKLAENTFRDVNIAFANQLALICEQHGVDVTRVIEGANTHPRVDIHTPGPGVGGPCLPKDPYLLINNTKITRRNIVKTARQINDSMPKHIVKLILRSLKETGKDVRSSKIAVLGTAYKANLDDSRQAPSKPIIHELLLLGADVVIYDPHCNESFRAIRASSLQEAIKSADCMTIVSDHSEFKNLNLGEVKALMNRMPTIVDGRRIISADKAEESGFIYYGVGFSTHANENSAECTDCVSRKSS